MSAEKTFNALPGWAKGVIAVGTVAAIGISSYLIYKKIKNIKALRDSKKEVDAINSDLNKEIQKGVKPTLSPSAVMGVANNLKTAFDGYGTDYDMILKNIVKINNQLDFYAVVKAYGVRKISSGKGNPSPDFEGTLGQTMAEELDDKQLQAVNMMLAKKGIKNRF